MDEIDELEIAIPKSFTSFNPNGVITVYQRHLPHWRQNGATYFVTFRLADSIPERVLLSLKEEREEWTKVLETSRQNSPNGRIPESIRAEYEAFHQRYWKVIEQELDQSSGSCELRSSTARNFVSNAIRHFADKRYFIYAAVVMPNHCHVLIKPFDGNPLEKVIASWKSFTANKINRITGVTGTFWQDESFDRIVRDENHFRKCVRYILKNPAKANLKKGEYECWMEDTLNPKE